MIAIQDLARRGLLRLGRVTPVARGRVAAPATVIALAARWARYVSRAGQYVPGWIRATLAGMVAGLLAARRTTVTREGVAHPPPALRQAGSRGMPSKGDAPRLA